MATDKFTNEMPATQGYYIYKNKWGNPVVVFVHIGEDGKRSTGTRPLEDAISDVESVEWWGPFDVNTCLNNWRRLKGC